MRPDARPDAYVRQPDTTAPIPGQTRPRAQPADLFGRDDRRMPLRRSGPAVLFHRFRPISDHSAPASLLPGTALFRSTDPRTVNPGPNPNEAPK